MKRRAIAIFIVAIGSGITPLLAQLPSNDPSPAQFATTYDALRSLDRREGKKIYATLEPAARQAVWTRHLLSFLEKHPELSDDQRDVILQGLGLLATGIFAIDPGDDRWQSIVGDPTTRIIGKAKALLPRDLVIEAFYSLEDRAAPVKSASGRFVPRTLTQDCDCSTVEGCEDPRFTCYTGGPHFCAYVPSWYCGPFYTYLCDGLCGF